MRPVELHLCFGSGVDRGGCTGCTCTPPRPRVRIVYLFQLIAKDHLQLVIH